jgi:hypothetical protein
MGSHALKSQHKIPLYVAMIYCAAYCTNDAAAPISSRVFSGGDPLFEVGRPSLICSSKLRACIAPR